MGRRQKMGQPHSSGAVQGTHTVFWGVWALKRKRHHCVNRWKLRSDFRVLSSVTWSPLAGKCARCCPRCLRSPARPPTQTRPFPQELAWWAVFLSPANVLCAGRRSCVKQQPGLCVEPSPLPGAHLDRRRGPSAPDQPGSLRPWDRQGLLVSPVLAYILFLNKTKNKLCESILQLLRASETYYQTASPLESSRGHFREQETPNDLFS